MFNIIKKINTILVDKSMLAAIFSIMLLGFIAFCAADYGDKSFIFKRVIQFIEGIIVLGVASFIPIKWYRKLSPYVYALLVLSLIAVHFIGVRGLGATRWLSVGPIHFQPSNFMEFIIPIFLSSFLTRKEENTFIDIILSLIFLLIPFVIIAKEPDLGTALLVVFSGLGVLFLAGISKKLIALFIVISGILAIILWNFVLLTYQKTRVLVFLHLEHSSLGAGYNIIQSKITLGSGGFIGNLFSGSQLRLGFLPEAHTDFIFSSYGNALGFLGVAILLSLYLFLIFKIFYTGFQFEDNFIKLSVLSIGFSVFIYSFINILMDIGAIPVVGVPLPLVSFGGSNIIMIMGYFGFVLAAKKEFLKSKVI